MHWPFWRKTGCYGLTRNIILRSKSKTQFLNALTRMNEQWSEGEKVTSYPCSARPAGPRASRDAFTGERGIST
jgi:hypothetical protein